MNSRLAGQASWRRAGLGIPAAVTVAGALLGLVVDDYLLVRYSLWAISGLLALSLELIWGQVGIFSFGQTAFFGVAGYTYGAVAINLARHTGETTTALLAAVLVAAALAALLGYFMFYGRVSDVYLGIITLAVTLVLLTFFASTAGPQYAIGSARLGGYNGMTGIPPVALGIPGLFGLRLDVRSSYIFVVLTAGAVYMLLKLLLRAPFGRILAAVRVNEVRAELLGYDTRWFKLVAFIIGGAVAGLAGAEFAAWGLFINPAVFSLPRAAVVVIWVLTGGRGTLAGAFLGAFAVEGLSTVLGRITAQTPLILGVLLILTVLLLPSGLIPALTAVWQRLRPARPPAGPAAPGHRPPAPVSPLPSPQVRAWPAGPGPTNSGPVLETRDLSVAFGGLKALDGVGTQFRQGLHCLIGPNGAGKSTFFNLLVGRYRPTAGQILYRGREVTRLEPHQRARQGIGIKLQVPSIFTELTVAENVWLAAYNRLRDERKADCRMEEVLEQVGLLARAPERAAHLSHGEQQWLEIGMVLAARPDLILLDEPTAGMTREETARTAQLITGLAGEATVVVVEHDMEFVRQLGAPVTVLHQGRVFKQGSLEELRQDEDVLNIYLGRRTHAAGD